MAGLMDLIGTPEQISAFKASQPLNTAPVMAPVEATSPFANAMPSTMSGQPQAQYPMPVIQDNYNPMTDPEGPLARAGWIGALLFGHGQSGTEHMAALKSAQERQVGIQRAEAFKQLSTMMQQGMDPNVAFLQFMQTPAGANFIASDPNPAEALKTFITVGQNPHPFNDARRQVFGGDMSLSKVTPDPAQMEKAQAINGDLTGVNSVDQNTNTAMRTVAGYEIPAYLTPEHLLAGAAELSAVGDIEGAKLAETLAEEMRLNNAASQPATTDEIKEYNLYAEQTKAAGGKPMSWYQYKRDMMVKNVETPEDAASKERMKAIIALDKKTAEEAQTAALAAQKVLPALETAVRLADKVPGGYKGSMLPTLGRMAELLGVPAPEGAGEAELLNSISMQLVPLVKTTGPVSNYEQTTFIQSVPSLVQTRVGRKMIAEQMRDMTERTIQLASIYREALANGEDPAKKAAEFFKDKGSPKLSEFARGSIMDIRAQEIKAAEQAGMVYYEPGAGGIATNRVMQPGFVDKESNMEYQGGDPLKSYNWVKVQ